MTQQQYIIRRKMNVVELAQTLGNISEACRNLGVSRQHYYDIKAAIQEDGVEGLLEKSSRNPRIANRLSPEIEERVLQYSLKFPTRGQKRVCNELKKQGVNISDGGVRGVWGRHQLLVKADRLNRLAKHAAEPGEVLTESQIVALESAKEEKQEHGEIETFHPGFLLGQDTYYVGYIKGVGKIYQQTGIERHPYQLFLHLNDIEHSRTKARHPQTNGCTERLNQIIQEEFYSVAFRKTLYTSIDQMQTNLDDYIAYYNNERTNQGKRCQGRTHKSRVKEQILSRTESLKIFKK